MKAKSLASNATLLVLFTILVTLLVACVGVVDPTSQPVPDTNQSAPLQITIADQPSNQVAVLPPDPPICSKQEFVELSILIDPLDSGGQPGYSANGAKSNVLVRDVIGSKRSQRGSGRRR